MEGIGGVPDLVPARMLNEFTYCPRLMFLEWVQADFADSVDTVDGRYVHRRVDKEGGAVPPAGEEEESERIHARSVLLSASGIGMIARIDLLEGADGFVSPVDYKRGTVPDVPGNAWEPEKVQVCAQALILRENGFSVTESVLYYAESRRRVTVPIDGSLETRTLHLLAEMRQLLATGAIPPPLDDSPKCPRCSLVGICLPDEVTMLARTRSALKDTDVRRLVPARDDALPLYVQAQGMTVGKSGDVLVVRQRGNVVQEVRAIDISQVALFGNVQMTAQALHFLCEREVPVSHFSYGGWFYGVTHGVGHKNVDLRMNQYRHHFDAKASLALARRIVNGKIRNSRTLLRRNAPDLSEEVLSELRSYSQKAEAASSAEELLGIEGIAARIYFSQFQRMLKPKVQPKDHPNALQFAFHHRNRRPPKDPVNALLSFAYALLTKDLTLTAAAVGFDPYLGFYHRPRYGRPALALDLMEEFRPIIGDSVVLNVVNNGEIGPDDFIQRAGAVALTPQGRKVFIQAYERRMDTLVTHPLFGYKVSYRRLLEVQTRLLGRFLSGEIAEYPSFQTR